MRAAARTAGSASASVSRRAQRRVACRAADTAAAGAYASALMDLATEAKVLDAVHADLDKVAGALANNEMREFLLNPVMEADNKKDVISKLAGELELCSYTTNFLCLLVDKQRMNSIEAIVSEFDSMYCERTNTTLATVTSAVELEEGQQALIAKKVQEITGAKSVKLKPVIDESVIGGLVLTLGSDGSTQIDLSVRGKLEEVERALAVAA
uniref:Uncharacterized protein n=1 Tax=Prasinoderma singulare TaxID=676789 RepID=A0A7S3FGM4_9VIRI